MENGSRILVADDHEIVRIGLVQTIKKIRPRATLREVDDYDALAEVVSKEKFDLAIIDVLMPNGTLQQAIDFIALRQPELKILVFSSQDETLYAQRYLKMGANGFLNKLSPKDTIARALTAMFKKGQYISEEVRETMVYNTLNKEQNTTAVESLTNRELEVAHKLVEGLPLKTISSELNLHSSTVSTYKNRLFQKLSIQSIPELVKILKNQN